MEQGLLAEWLRRHSLLVFLALVMLGTLRIVATYSIFSHTADEPAHIAAGMEWLDQGKYRYEPLHPPLARIASALGPYLDGRVSQHLPDMWPEGLAILGQGPNYDRTLTLARLGILPFFWIACLVVYIWGRRYFGEPVACTAVLIFSMLPPILAHAGLATTDMPLTAAVSAAFLLAALWAEKPTPGRSLSLGLGTGVAVLCKFSALAFLPVSLLAALIGYLTIERPPAATLLAQLPAWLKGLALAVPAALLLIWAGYRFSFGTVPFLQWRVPCPELFLGILQLINYNRVGAGMSYLLGQHGFSGWWYYYPVALGVKTPLSVLAMLALGLTLGARRPPRRGWWLALAFSGGILGFCLFSHINLGIRHILPVYLGFSLLAAVGICTLIERGGQWRPATYAAAALLLALITSSALAHPDYLPYFNPLAGAHPERILVDSDLDWGQDMKRLSLRLRQLGVSQLTFTPCASVDSTAIGLPPLKQNDFLHPAPGWNAIRLTPFELLKADQRVLHPGLAFWPDVVPPSERIGKGILLWHLPDVLPAAPAGLPTAHVYCPYS